MNIQHSSRTDLWYTPDYIIEMVREVLGEITLDPASDEIAQKTVKAANYYSEDSLNKEWYGNVYVNPPGGKTKNQSNTALYWKKLMESDVEHAIFMAFSIEALQNTQGKGVQVNGRVYAVCPLEADTVRIPHR